MKNERKLEIVRACVRLVMPVSFMNIKYCFNVSYVTPAGEAISYVSMQYLDNFMISAMYASIEFVESDFSNIK